MDVEVAWTILFYVVRLLETSCVEIDEFLAGHLAVTVLVTLLQEKGCLLLDARIVPLVLAFWTLIASLQCSLHFLGVDETALVFVALVEDFRQAFLDVTVTGRHLV